MFNKFWEQKADQKSCVSTDQLKDFPFNCIGYLKTTSKKTMNPQSKIGSGFLISRFLVLTSANLFIEQSKKTQIEQLYPTSFTLIDRKTSKRQYKIKTFKVNPQFIKLSKKIGSLKYSLERQGNSVRKSKLMNQISALTQERVKYDFALLKIDQRVRRCEVFRLIYKIDAPLFLSITGYSSINKKDLTLMTQSRKIKSIKNDTLFYDEGVGKELCGSPVYIEDQDNKVIGIQSSSDVANCATMITYDCIDTLQQWSIEMKAPFQAINRKQIIDPNDKIYENQQCYKTEDRRKQIKAPEITIFPYDCIGWLDGSNRFNESITGTGFLISECFVLTSAHTIHSIIDRNKFEKIPLTFSIFGLEKEIQITDFRINQKFMDLQNQKANINRILVDLDSIKDKKQIKQCKKQLNRLFQLQFPHDFALLKLEQKISKSQYFQICINFNDSEETLLTVSGYNDYELSYKLKTHSGLIDDVKNGAIFYDIDTKKGQSGSPVYINDKPNMVVGIHKAGSKQNQKNFATKITNEMIIQLKKWSIEMNPYFEVVLKKK